MSSRRASSQTGSYQVTAITLLAVTTYAINEANAEVRAGLDSQAPRMTPESEVGMKTLVFGILMVALLMALGQYSAAMPGEEQDKARLESMSVAELERTGDQFRAQKDYEQAIKYFQAALRQDKNNARLYNKLGLAELKISDFRAASHDFNKAAKIDRRFAEAFNNIGAVAYVQKNYGSATKYFKKALALNETSATFHVNLGAAWFSQNKLDRAMAEYTRALELDPEVFMQISRTGVSAQIASPEERARYSYMLAKIYAQRGDAEHCLQCLRKAKEDGYPDLARVYKDEEFSRLRQDARLAEVVPPPVEK